MPQPPVLPSARGAASAFGVPPPSDGGGVVASGGVETAMKVVCVRGSALQANRRQAARSATAAVRRGRDRDCIRSSAKSEEIIHGDLAADVGVVNAVAEGLPLDLDRGAHL